MVKKVFSSIYIYLILVLMYLPILVLIAFSFSGNDVISFTGDFNATFQLYRNLFSNTKVAKQIWVALGNTVIIAICSAIVSTILGTLGAIGTFYLGKKRKKAVEFVTQIPVANAEIVIAVSLTVMVIAIGVKFSFWTLLMGHVVLSVPFVYLSVKPKLIQMDPNTYEAALDLGANPRQALNKVVINAIKPGMASGFLLAITLSLDDYIVTEFTRGSGLLSGDASIETLSTFIQTSLKKHTVPAELRPLTLFIFLAVLGVVALVTIVRYKQSKKGVIRNV